MKKKVLVTLLVIALALVSVSAKDLGIKVGGELGWGIQTGSIKGESQSYDSDDMKTTNNGFSLNLTGEYAFDKNWSVKADFGLMFAGKAKSEMAGEDISDVMESSGLYIDFAVDGKYTYAINKQFSVSGLAGVELVSGYLAKIKNADEDDLKELKNTGFGINLGVEGGYNLNDDITIVAGFDFSWLFINTNAMVKDAKEDAKKYGYKLSVANFFMRPYVGATYAF